MLRHGSVLRWSAGTLALLLLLLVVTSGTARSVTQEEQERASHHRHHHHQGHHQQHHQQHHRRNNPGGARQRVRLDDQVRYDLGDPEPHARLQEPSAVGLDTVRWQAISRAAQNLGRAVSKVANAPPTPEEAPPRRHFQLDNRPGTEAETADDDDQDDFSDDEVLRVEATPAPALLSNDEQEAMLLAEQTAGENPLLQADSAAAAEQLLRTEGARPKKEFKPVRMPTRFESYDLHPTDGFITLGELVNVTGAKVNVRRAFNDSDKNGDGLLDPDEFYAAPWKLGPDWLSRANSHERQSDRQAPPSEEGDEDPYDQDDAYDDDDDDDEDEEEEERVFDEDDGEYDDEWDRWETLEDYEDYMDDLDDADIF